MVTVPDTWTGSVANNARLIETYLAEKLEFVQELEKMVQKYEKLVEVYRETVEQWNLCQQQYEVALQNLEQARSHYQSAMDRSASDVHYHVPYGVVDALRQAEDRLSQAISEWKQAEENKTAAYDAMVEYEALMKTKEEELLSFSANYDFLFSSSESFSFNLEDLVDYRQKFFQELRDNLANCDEKISSYLESIDKNLTIIQSDLKNYGSVIENYCSHRDHICNIFDESYLEADRYFQFINTCVGKCQNAIDGSIQDAVLAQTFSLFFDSMVEENVTVSASNVFGFDKSSDVSKLSQNIGRVENVSLENLYTYDESGNVSLETVHPKLDEKMNQLVERCKEEGINIKITSTVRSVSEQDSMVEQGVSNAAGSDYQSFHQWGLAFDVCNNVKGDAYNEDILTRVGEIGESLGLEWGGRWTGLVDMPHFQLNDFGSTSQELKEEYLDPGGFADTW